MNNSESRLRVPIYQKGLSNLITEIVDSPLPIEVIRIKEGDETKIKKQLMPFKMLVINFSGLGFEIDPPGVNSVEELLRFNNISILNINIEEQFYGVYSILLAVIHGVEKFEKILLYDFFNLFKLDRDKGVVIPLECFNFRFLINILNLVLDFRDLVKFVESDVDILDHCLIPRTLYIDESKLISDLYGLQRLDDNHIEKNWFINLQYLLLSLGFEVVVETRSK